MTLTALTKAVPVSIEPSLVSPIFKPMTWAPGAMPFVAGQSGKLPAAMHATWVPWEPDTKQTIKHLTSFLAVITKHYKNRKQKWRMNKTIYYTVFHVTGISCYRKFRINYLTKYVILLSSLNLTYLCFNQPYFPNKNVCGSKFMWIKFSLSTLKISAANHVEEQNMPLHPETKIT